VALPPNVKSKIQASFHSQHSLLMGESKGNVQSSNNVARHSSTRMLDEPSPQQARAIDKILRLPAKTA
jgi:hypothetical protein